MTAIDRVKQAANSSELRSFNICVMQDMDSDSIDHCACVNLTVKFDLDETELDRLTDHGLKANVKQKLRIAMRSMSRKINEDLRRLG